MVSADTINLIVMNQLIGQNREIIDLLKSKSDWLTTWMPSIIGLITVFISLVIAKQQIKSAQQTAQQQIQSAERIAEAQFENAKEVTITEIKAHVIAAARKEWIENLRTNIAAILALADDIHRSISSNEKAEAVKKFPELRRLRTYIELMLNINEQEHKDFLITLESFVIFCLEGKTDTDKWVDLKTNYVSSAKGILKSEWVRVKSFT